MKLEKIIEIVKQRQFPMEFPGHWIGNTWAFHGRADISKASLNPSNGEKIVDVAINRELVGKALDCSSQALGTMEELSIEDRLGIIKKFHAVLADYRDLVISAMRIELGKTQSDAESELVVALEFLEQAIQLGPDLYQRILAPTQLGHKWHFQLQPVGVALAFVPFTTPLTSFVQYTSASILAGCPLLIMVSGNAALNGMIDCGLLDAIDLPKNAVNVMFGGFQSFRQCLLDKRIKAVMYSGSREHCDTIRKESEGLSERQLMLQSGGKNSVLILDDADGEVALNTVINGLVSSAGQLNVSTSRVFVPRQRLAEFSEQLTQRLNTLRIGRTDLSDEGPVMGPLYSRKAVEKFLRFQTMAKRMSEQTLCWGKATDKFGDGFFVTPGAHIIEKFEPTSAYQSNVLMTPDLAIHPYDEVDAAVAAINDTEAPLVVSIVTKNLEQPCIKMFKAPNVVLNLATTGIGGIIPVVGKGQCGHHRMHGLGYVFHLTYPKAIVAKNADTEQI